MPRGRPRGTRVARHPRSGPVRGGPGSRMVRARASAPADSRPAERGVRGDHGSDLRAVAEPDRCPSAGGPMASRLPDPLGEGLGGDAGADRGGAMTVTPRVVVVGGGLAGLSAALACVDGGAAVTLLEAKPWLGGATSSFRRDGLTIDTGQ